MNILREFKDFNTSQVVLFEENNKTGGKDLYLKGIFMQADLKNQNGRVYPLHEISREVEKARKIFAQGGNIPGECEHPSELQINLDRISHKITDMWMEGTNAMGKMQILPTACGQTIRVLLENGIKLGVSSRGSGEVNFNGVVSNFELVTVDIVATPSAPNAYPKPVFESLYNMKGCQIIENLAKEVSYNKYDVAAEYHFKKEILKFIKELKK